MTTNIKTPQYYRARIQSFKEWIQNVSDNQHRKWLSYGFVRENEHQAFDNYVDNRIEAQSNEPLSFTELTTFNTWYAMHPEKIAGKMQGGTSLFFPVVVKGTRQDVDNLFKQAMTEETQSDNSNELELLELEAEAENEMLKLVEESIAETPKFKYEIGDKFRNEKDGSICTIIDRFVSDGKTGYYLMFPNKVQEQHPVITEDKWLDSLVKLPLPKYKVGQMVEWNSFGSSGKGYVKDVDWSNLFKTYKYEIIDFLGGMAYEVKEYDMYEISLRYSEEKSYSISQPVCKEGDFIHDKKTKKTYTVRKVLLFNVYHKYKNQRFGVGGTVVKSSASYYYYVCEHSSPYIEKDFTVVESLGDADGYGETIKKLAQPCRCKNHCKIN